MAGEALRAEAAKGEEEFDDGRTRGLPPHRAFGRGEPLLRCIGVGAGGETLTSAAVRAGAGASDSDSQLSWKGG